MRSSYTVDHGGVCLRMLARVDSAGLTPSWRGRLSEPAPTLARLTLPLSSLEEWLPVQVVPVVDHHLVLRIEPIDQVAAPIVRTENWLTQTDLHNSVGCLHGKTRRREMCVEQSGAIRASHRAGKSPNQEVPRRQARGAHALTFPSASCARQTDSPRERRLRSQAARSALALAPATANDKIGATVSVKRREETGRLREA